MEIKAPAKINLFLNVGKKEKSGFHSLLSVITKINLYDRLEISESDTVKISGMDWLPQEENIVYKAALKLREYTGTDKGCRINIEKEIPHGAGLGGGSSDAAAALKGLNKLWDTGLDKKQLSAVGENIGSDVNLFLFPGSALLRGRGQTVEPLGTENIFKGAVVLIMPDIKISTRKIYENYPGGSLTGEKELNKIIAKFKNGEWTDILRNDLQHTVFREYPVLKDIYSRLINWGAKPLLSGSGASLFALTDNADTAESIAGIVSRNFNYRSSVVKPVVGE